MAGFTKSSKPVMKLNEGPYTILVFRTDDFKKQKNYRATTTFRGAGYTSYSRQINDAINKLRNEVDKIIRGENA